VAPGRLPALCGAAAACGLLLLFAASAPFRLWLGHAPAEASRCWAHHLLPLRAEAAALVRAAGPAAEAGELAGIHARASRLAGQLAGIGLDIPSLGQARARVQLRLAEQMLHTGTAARAGWHLLQAARHLEQPGELEAALHLASRLQSWRAAAAAQARLELDLGAAGLPPPPAAASSVAAELSYWLGHENAARQRPAEAERHWRACAGEGLAPCHSALARLARARGAADAALWHDRQALALDPGHWPSLKTFLPPEDPTR
jgi:hypothetical protein